MDIQFHIVRFAKMDISMLRIAERAELSARLELRMTLNSGLKSNHRLEYSSSSGRSQLANIVQGEHTTRKGQTKTNDTKAKEYLPFRLPPKT